LRREHNFSRPEQAGKGGGTVAILVGLSFILAGCMPGSLMPPTPTDAPELRIESQPTVATTPTVPLVRRLNSVTSAVVRPTAAANVVRAATQSPSEVPPVGPPLAGAPPPTEVGLYPPPSGSPITLPTQPSQPSRPAPAAPQPPGPTLTLTPTWTGTPAIPPPVATQPLPNPTPTRTPTPLRLPSTPTPPGGYPSDNSNPPLSSPSPFAGYTEPSH